MDIDIRTQSCMRPALGALVGQELYLTHETKRQAHSHRHWDMEMEEETSLWKLKVKRLALWELEVWIPADTVSQTWQMGRCVPVLASLWCKDKRGDQYGYHEVNEDD